jgi:hypothetical protein
MMRRLLLAVVAVAALLVALGGPASAGGWAVTTLDPLPAGGIAPGRPTAIGYTVRQHGITPVALADSALLVTLADGRVLRFPGVPDASPGHHVAEVTLPIAGHFALAVDQGWFADEDLGHLDVGSAAAPVTPPPTTGDSNGGVPVVPAVLTGVAVALLAAQIVSAVRSRRRPVPAASA